MKAKSFFSMIAIIVLMISSAAAQEIPQMIYYQGSLADASGKPVNVADHWLPLMVMTSSTANGNRRTAP